MKIVEYIFFGGEKVEIRVLNNCVVVWYYNILFVYLFCDWNIFGSNKGWGLDFSLLLNLLYFLSDIMDL